MYAILCAVLMERLRGNDTSKEKSQPAEIIDYLLEKGVSEVIAWSLQLPSDQKALLKKNLRQWEGVLASTASLNFMNPEGLLDIDELRNIAESPDRLPRGVKSLAREYLENVEKFGEDALAQLRLPIVTHNKLVRKGIKTLTELRQVINSPGGLVSGWDSADGRWKNAMLSEKPATYVRQRLEQFDSSQKSSQSHV